MITWRPEPTGAALDRQHMAASIRQNFLRLGETLGAQDTITSRLSTFPHGEQGLQHPECFDLQNEVVARVRAGQAPTAEAFATMVEETAAVVEASIARATDNAARLRGSFDLAPSRRGLGVLRRAVATRMPEKAGRAVLLDPSGALLEPMRAAYQVLADAWPEAFAELQVFVDRILVFDFPGMLGFSGLEFHGGIFLRREDLADPIKLAENILHEGSHVRLNAAMARTRYFVDDPRGRYASPLRTDPRPIFGVFHQMFVLGRMLHFHDRVSERLGVSHPQHAVVRRQFREALEAIEAHCALTDDGRALTAALEEVESTRTAS